MVESARVGFALLAFLAVAFPLPAGARRTCWKVRNVSGECGVPSLSFGLRFEAFWQARHRERSKCLTQVSCAD